MSWILASRPNNTKLIRNPEATSCVCLSAKVCYVKLLRLEIIEADPSVVVVSWVFLISLRSGILADSLAD